MPQNSGLTIRPLGGFVQAIQRLYQQPADTIRSIDATSYGSPGQPIKPIAPAGTEPRGWEWWMGQNMNFVPRPDAEYSAQDLKALATYPLARICIENLKDQICMTPWEFRLKRQPGETRRDLAERSKGDENLKKLNKFWEYPDTEHDWAEWLRPLLDDLLVIDGVAVLMRQTMKGELAECRVLRGESITRLIDGNGWTPISPEPAYQQNWWGLPLVNLTTDQLVYAPRNIVPRNTVSSQLYGYSQTEQVAEEIKIGMKRLNFILSYYEDGSIPGVVHVVPKGTTSDKIAETMLWMNSQLAGNLAARNQWRMIPGFNEPGTQDQIIPMKDKLLSDPFDELHIRKICFGYGTSPQRLMRMMGTRNAEAQQEASQEEGVLPILNWLRTSIINKIVHKRMGLIDYELVFDPDKESDSLKQAQTAQIYVDKAVKTINQVREDLGLDKSDEPEADVLCYNGVPISGAPPSWLQDNQPWLFDEPEPQPIIVAPGSNAANAEGGQGGGVPSKKPASGSGGGAGAKPAGEKEPAAKTNGHGTIRKGHCRRHASYSENCIACADNEIHRLEKLTSSFPKAVATRRVVQPNPRGSIGFFSSATVQQPLQLPPQFQKDDSESDEEGSWITINGVHVHLNSEGEIDKGPKELVGTKPGDEKEVKEASTLYSRSFINGKKISVESAAYIKGEQSPDYGFDKEARILVEKVRQAPEDETPLFRSVSFDENSNYKQSLDSLKSGSSLSLDRISSFSSQRDQAAYYSTNGQTSYELQIVGKSKSFATDKYTGMEHAEHITQGKFEVVAVKGGTRVKLPEAYKGSTHYKKVIVLRQIGVF